MEARHFLIPRSCSRTSAAEQAHKYCSCGASWDRQGPLLQQKWVEGEAPESGCVEAVGVLHINIHFFPGTRHVSGAH